MGIRICSTHMVVTFAVVVVVGMMIAVAHAAPPARGTVVAGDDKVDEDGISRNMVIQIVNKAAEEIKKDALSVFKAIIAKEHPYVDKDIEALYVFVYDTEVNMVAHPNQALVGRNYKGRPDVRGKNFRDLIVEGAVKNGSGWENYAYQKPGATGIHDKIAFYMLVKGSDGKDYVVVSGMYKTQ